MNHRELYVHNFPITITLFSYAWLFRISLVVYHAALFPYNFTSRSYGLLCIIYIIYMNTQDSYLKKKKKNADKQLCSLYAQALWLAGRPEEHELIVMAYNEYVWVCCQ